MSGSVEGGRKTRDHMLAQDPDYYKKLGAIGGKLSNNGGFASNKVGKDGLTGRQRSRIVGVIGGNHKKGYRREHKTANN